MSNGRLERIIGIVLRTGVATSSVCLAAGLALSLGGSGTLADVARIQRSPILLARLGAVVLGVLRSDGEVRLKPDATY